MSKKKALIGMMTNRGGAGASVAGAIDFDGNNDYLIRATDLVGNTDSKTFTFSAWIYVPHRSGKSDYIYTNKGDAPAPVQIMVNTLNKLRVFFKNSSDGNLYAFSSNVEITGNTFVHVLFSADLSDTSKRHVYINDVADVPTYTYYVDDLVDFTTENHYVGVDSSLSTKAFGRFSHVYLDHTYRDLSVEANRRLFSTFDPEKGLIPTDGQAVLNPIIYLPLNDPEAAGINEGAGGDFVLNGTVARSGRGPNQYNVAVSEFDGVSDYLQRSVSGLSDETTILVSGATKMSDATGTSFIGFNLVGSSLARFQVYQLKSNARLYFIGRDAAGDVSLNAYYEGVPQNSIAHFQCFFDTTSPENNQIIINGKDVSAEIVYGSTVGASFGFSAVTTAAVALSQNGSSKSAGVFGDLWCETGVASVNLADQNPFWDSATHKPKYLGEQGELPTGSQPLIYLPLRAEDAGKNLGSVGDFTVNGGPFTGIRGASEFWAKSITTENTVSSTSSPTNYLSIPALSGASSSTNTFSFVCFVKANDTTFAGDNVIFQITDGGQTGLEVRGDVNEYLEVYADATFSISSSVVVFNNTDWHLVMATYSGSHFKTYIDDTSYVKASSGRVFDFSGKCSVLGGGSDNTAEWVGSVGFLYFSEEYIDFSQEANRLKFVDALGYPVDIQPAIDAGDIPSPLVHMKFEDPDALGYNSGIGGDFTINGTVTAGGDVNG